MYTYLILFAVVTSCQVSHQINELKNRVLEFRNISYKYQDVWNTVKLPCYRQFNAIYTVSIKSIYIYIYIYIYILISYVYAHFYKVNILFHTFNILYIIYIYKSILV